MTVREPSGGLESGLAASLTGSVRIAIVSGGVACLAGALAVTLALPALWRYDARTYRPDPAGPDLAGPDLAGPDLAGPDLAGPDPAGGPAGVCQP